MRRLSAFHLDISVCTLVLACLFGQGVVANVDPKKSQTEIEASIVLLKDIIDVRQRKTKIYVEAGAKRWRRIRDIVGPLIERPLCSDNGTDILNEQLLPMGFETKRVGHGQHQYRLIQERSGLPLQGHGIYIFKCKSPHSKENIRRVIQIPHAFFDMHTETIGIELFVNGHFDALWVNTFHRYKGRRGEKKSDAFHIADAAHNRAHIFHAVATGAAHASVKQEWLQIHGFKERAGDPDVILSCGERVVTDTCLTRLARYQKTAPHLNSLIYDQGNHRLGGTTNVQGHLSRHAQIQFVHIELCQKVRLDLKRGAKKIFPWGNM